MGMDKKEYTPLQDRLSTRAGDVYSPLDNDVYDKYNVKRGLRYKDGTGVMAGLTSIGEVSGYNYVDGKKLPAEGHLRYRGYDLVDLVKHCEEEDRFGFEEVAYLLLFAKLPTKKELELFTKYLGHERELPEGFTEDMILKAPSGNIMNKLGRCILASYSYDKNPDEISIGNVLRQSIEIIAHLPVMAEYGYQAKKHYHDGKSLILHKPQPELSTAENILYMLRDDNKYTKEEAELLDIMLMVHAEHGGGNNSAFTARVVSSTGTDTYSAISAAIGSLKGPKHGGANAKVVAMMENIKANIKNWEDEDEVSKYLEKIIRKEAFDGSGLVYGMGHAIYTLSDPRSVIIRNKAESGVKDDPEKYREFKLYRLIEKLTPDIFRKVKGIDKAMCANVDLYSGFVYQTLGIPEELYTPLFAISRIVGWCAHRLEEVHACGKIIRPAYQSIPEPKQYIGIDDREDL